MPNHIALKAFAFDSGRESLADWEPLMSTGEGEALDSVTEKESTQAATTTADDQRIALANNLDALLPTQALHNFGGSPSENWKLMAMGQNGSSPGSDLDKDSVIQLRYFYMHRVTMVDPKNGEITNPIRTVLYDANGQMWHFVSDGIAKAVGQLIQAFGVNEFAPPVPIKIVELRTRSGHRTLSLIPA